jgi:hypothetical protein
MRRRCAAGDPASRTVPRAMSFANNTAASCWFRPEYMRTYVRMKGKGRRCARCGEVKPLSDFNWRRISKRERDTYCRPCRSAYGKEHYVANRQRYIDLEAKRKRARAQKRMRYLLEYFEVHPCADCGEADPMVLEFDHLRDKSFAIGAGLPDRNWESILREIEKCDVVCANCHRRRTAKRAGTVRALIAAATVNS